MSDFINKILFKNKCVRAIICTDAHRYTIRYLIPTVDQTITVKQCSYAIDDHNFYFYKGIPTYIYNASCPSPLNVNTIGTDMTSQHFNIALSAKVEREVFLADKKGLKPETLILVFGLLVLGAVGGAIYLMLEKFSAMETEIEALKNLIQLLGGIG